MSRISISKFSAETKFLPLKGNVFVTDMEEGARLSRGGIIIADDNATTRGIRARWSRVWAVGPEVIDLEVGQWVLTEHGRWTERIVFQFGEAEPISVWRIEHPKYTLMAADADFDPRDAIPMSF